MLKRLICLTIFVLLPSVAFAAKHAEGPPPGIESIAWPVANFVLYCVLLARVFRNKILPALDMRARTITERLQKAHETLASAEAELLEVENRMVDVATEQRAIIESLRNEGRNIAAEVKRSAERSAENIRQDVTRRAGREAEQARAEIRAEVVRQAGEKARELLAQQLSGDEDKRLREEALRALF